MVLSLGNQQFYFSVLQTLQIDAKIGLYVMCDAFPSQLPKFNGISPYKYHLFNEKYIQIYWYDDRFCVVSIEPTDGPAPLGLWTYVAPFTNMD